MIPRANFTFPPSDSLRLGANDAYDVSCRSKRARNDCYLGIWTCGAELPNQARARLILPATDTLLGLQSFCRTRGCIRLTELQTYGIDMYIYN
jgi:hypothetical protein